MDMDNVKMVYVNVIMDGKEKGAIKRFVLKIVDKMVFVKKEFANATKIILEICAT